MLSTLSHDPSLLSSEEMAEKCQFCILLVRLWLTQRWDLGIDDIHHPVNCWTHIPWNNHLTNICKVSLLKFNWHKINCTYLIQFYNFEICTYPWNPHYNQDDEHIHHLLSFLLSLYDPSHLPFPALLLSPGNHWSVVTYTLICIF